MLGTTNHFVLGQAIGFESATRARGLLPIHAEVWRKEQPMLSALRYDDGYEKSGGLW